MTNAEYQLLVEFLGQQFAAIDQRFVAIGRRFDSLDDRFVAIGHRFDAMDLRFDARGSRLDDGFRKMREYFAAISLLLDRLEQHCAENTAIVRRIEAMLVSARAA